MIEECDAAGVALRPLDELLGDAEPAPEELPATSWGTPRDLSTWSAPAAGGLAWRQRSAELRAHGAGERALRELLALQSSDWAFLLTHGTAGDYPRERFEGHWRAFEAALRGEGEPRLRNLAPSSQGLTVVQASACEHPPSAAEPRPGLRAIVRPMPVIESGGGLIDAATEHLRRADPVLRELIDRIGPLDEEARRRGRPDDAYGALLRAIVGQQLSTSAARSIYGRLLELFGGVPTPAELLAADQDALRTAGLSRAKVAYLRDLAERVESGELELDRLAELPDDEVSAQLLAVKGLGRWTIDMFLMFHLRRPDVLAVGDLGIRRAVEVAYGLDTRPDAATVERIGEPWRPHRTLACLYLWTSLDAIP